MININIRESLRELDNDTCCKYNLLTMYNSCNLSDDDKRKLVKLLYDKEDPEVIYQNLCMYFCDDDVSGIDDINDVLVSSAFEEIVTECVSKLKEKYDDAKYNDVSNQLEVITNGTLYTTGVSPVDYDVSDIEVFVDGNYDEPIIFSSIQDAIKYILDVVSNKINTISIIEGDDDIMVYTIYDIVEDEDRLTAKCMNESTNDFQDIKLGKINSQKVNELLNNLLNNPNYKLTDECKKKIYDNAAPWGLAVQMVPSVDIDGTNGLLSTGSFSGEASFGESLEEFFEKDDRVTDGDRQGTVLDYDSQKVLVEWDYSDTDDIEWVDKSDIEVIKIDKELYEFVQQPVNNKNVKRKGKLITAINESYSRSDLRQASVDAIEYFMEFEDIYPFPKEKFLASNWKELRDGVAMGMDDDLEIAEGIMEYLQKEIDFNNKHKEIYEDDPQAELTLEIYNMVKRGYEKEISRYESDSSKVMNEASYGSAFDIEDDMFFTRDDLVDFGEKVCEILDEIYPDTFDISDTYIHDNNILFLEVTSKQGNEGSANFKIDMRKIKKPSDLLKFAYEMAFYLRQDLEDLYSKKIHESKSAEKPGDTFEAIKDAYIGPVDSIYNSKQGNHTSNINRLKRGNFINKDGDIVFPKGTRLNLSEIKEINNMTYGIFIEDSTGAHIMLGVPLSNNFKNIG